mgnify:CR=1 FL=1
MKSTFTIYYTEYTVEIIHVRNNLPRVYLFIVASIGSGTSNTSVVDTIQLGKQTMWVYSVTHIHLLNFSIF